MNQESRIKEEREDRARSSRSHFSIFYFLFSIRARRGISLVEIIIGTAILLLAFTGIIAAYSIFTKAGFSTMSAIQASYLLEEGVEAITSLRDSGWTTNISALTSGAKYYFYWNGSTWASTASVSKIDNIYERYFTLGNVYRDSNDNIAPSGTIDSGTKQVTVVVSWQNGATTTSRSLSTYLTNLFSN